MVATGEPDDYAVDHPHTALRVVEVADTTLEADTHEKASLYAAGGVPDYWVIDIHRAAAFLCSATRGRTWPRCSATSTGRCSPTGPDETWMLLAAPDPRIPVADLLPRDPS